MSVSREDRFLIELDLDVLQAWVKGYGLFEPLFVNSARQVTENFCKKILPKVIEDFGSIEGHEKFLGLFVIYIQGFVSTFIRIAMHHSLVPDATLHDKMGFLRMWVDVVFSSFVKDNVFGGLENNLKKYG